MNDQPLGDYSETALLCINDKGLFLAEEDDGRATCVYFVTSPIRAKRFDHHYYGAPVDITLPLHEPSYYQHHVPAGCRMVMVKIITTLWEKAYGPPQPPEKKSPFVKLFNQ